MITPYVSAAAFTAHPTYLDLDDLRAGDNLPADQNAELGNLLLMASTWADGYVEQPLAAHQVTQSLRTTCDRYGQLKIHPDHTPVIAVSSVAYGYSPTSLTTVSAPSVWNEDGRNLVIPLAAAGPWSGSLQFGTPAAGQRLFVQVTYTAGFVATTLAGASALAATSLTVTDPTGIQPGGAYRIWEPGAEETVTVAASYTPPAVAIPPAATAVPLAAPAVYPHNAGHDIGNLPADARLAVTNYAVSILLRPDTSSEDAYPDTRLAAGTRQNDVRKDGSGLVDEAERLLERLRRVR